MWKIAYISVIAGCLLASCTPKYEHYATDLQEKYTADARFCQESGGFQHETFTQCMSRRGWSQYDLSPKAQRR